MRIRVNDEWLDMSQTLVGIHWANMRFSDIFQETYSTDFELPMTAKNMRLLDVFSVLSRRGDPYASMVSCHVILDGLSSDGLISVDGVSGELIRCTVYFAQLPAVMGETVTRLVTDNADTIVDLTVRPLEDNTTTANAVNYTLYQSDSNVNRPNVKLNYLLSRLTEETGIAFPTVQDTIRLIGTRQVVCPQNARQLIEWSVGGQSYEISRYGQHIANDVDTDNKWITVNRAETLSVTLYYHTVTAVSGAIARFQISSNGGVNWANIQDVPLDDTERRPVSFSVTLQSGDIWRIIFIGWTGTMMSACSYSNYEITGDDYDMPLSFESGADYSIPSWVSEDASFVYYGVLANLPTFTVREMLSSLAWMMGKRIRIMPFAVQLVDADVSKHIEAHIDSVDFGCDKLGRSLTIESANGETLARATIDNEKLQDAVTMHKSIFARLQGVGSWGIVDVDFYDNEGKAVDYDGGVALAVQTVHSSGTYYLRPWGAWSMLDIDTLTRVAMIDAVTLEKISDCDYVYIAGHKFMLIEGDVDESTGLTNFKALTI